METFLNEIEALLIVSGIFNLSQTVLWLGIIAIMRKMTLGLLKLLAAMFSAMNLIWFVGILVLYSGAKQNSTTGLTVFMQSPSYITSLWCACCFNFCSVFHTGSLSWTTWPWRFALSTQTQINSKTRLPGSTSCTTVLGPSMFSLRSLDMLLGFKAPNGQPIYWTQPKCYGFSQQEYCWWQWSSFKDHSARKAG